MTQEEKAKRYDEALEELRGLLEGIREEKCEILEEDITSIFPELQENEDERIRKGLIKAFGSIGKKEWGGVNVKNAIAWLENQKEFVSADFDDVWETADCDELTVPLEKYSKDAIKKMCHAWYDKGIELERRNWLEKQGEQKPQGKTALEAINEEKVDNSNRVEPKDYNSIDPHFGKPADKVEPKFHEGEWLCENEPNNYARFIQILEIVDVQGKERYRISRDIHNDEDIVEFDFVEKYYHKFDIEDAKDGDVLYSPKGAGVECIFLIKGWKQVECTGKTLCSNIGYRVEEDEIVVSGLGAIWWGGVVDPFYPATKEQRDLLEKAMADAGYTFDFEKKELKKIEDEIEIPFGAKDSELQEATYYIPKGFYAEIDDDKVVIKKGEKPTEWSEEDNVMIRCITLDLELLKNRDDGEAGKAAYQSEIEWLKSIKDRYT